MPEDVRDEKKPAPDMDKIQVMLNSSDWRERQTAARFLGDINTELSTDLLREVCANDPEPVVAYTAGVNMLNHMTKYAWIEALKVARNTIFPS